MRPVCRVRLCGVALHGRLASCASLGGQEGRRGSQPSLISVSTRNLPVTSGLIKMINIKQPNFSLQCPGKSWVPSLLSLQGSALGDLPHSPPNAALCNAPLPMLLLLLPSALPSPPGLPRCVPPLQQIITASGYPLLSTILRRSSFV